MRGSGDTPGARIVPPGLHVVATPIGNLGDITHRALAVLAAADVIACEDSRITGRLLHHFGIAGRMVVYNDHTGPAARPGLLARLQAGERVALVTDAGTPLVSDPGYRLVADARAVGIAVHAVPGACALTAALSVAGLPTDRFLFAGFLPPKQAARRTALADLADLKATLVFFESGPRLPAMLADMAEVLGARQGAVARELTKLHEEVARGTLSDLAARYAGAPPKGEIVVIAGPSEAAAAATDDDVDALLLVALEGSGVKEASASVAAATGRQKRDVYARALALRDT